MPQLTRRQALYTGCAAIVPPGMVTLMAGCQETQMDKPATGNTDDSESKPVSQESNPATKGTTMKIQYLEIVTPEADALCAQYSAMLGITFSDPIVNLGNARTAKLSDGGMLGIRGPMRETETPVVRPYALVDDIKSAVEAAAKTGAEIAMPPTPIPEHGTFAIVIRGGIECGLWQI